MNDDLVPSEILSRIIKWWWVLVVLMIAGGIAGMLVTRAHAPVYESNAAITTSIDYAYAGRITDEDEDYLLSAVGDLIDSSSVFAEVIEQANQNDLNLSSEEIESNFSKSRQGFRWELSVRDTDPRRAQKLADLWVNAASEELAKLRKKSLDSLHDQSIQLAIERCFSQMVSIDPASASCSIEQLSELRESLNQPDAGSLSIYDSILLSKISTQITDEASLPASPTLFKQNINTLMGALIALVIGLALITLWNPKQR